MVKEKKHSFIIRLLYVALINGTWQQLKVHIKQFTGKYFVKCCLKHDFIFSQHLYHENYQNLPKISMTNCWFKLINLKSNHHKTSILRKYTLRQKTCVLLFKKIRILHNAKFRLAWILLIIKQCTCETLITKFPLPSTIQGYIIHLYV